MVAPKNDNQAAVLEEALTSFIDEYLRDEHPNIEEFIAQYPECEVQLKERIQDLREIYTLFDSLVHADDSDFEDNASRQNLVGQTLANFEIEKVVGRGGMGIVYLARDTKLDRYVAIKSMPTGLLSNPSAQNRFRREAKLLASLNHPNIAVIHDIIEDDPQAAYLVLEYVPGQTLAQRIAHKPLKLEEALTIGLQITEAVSAAHENGVIHRDLKPGNIKITPDGRIKVLDFGLAKAFGGQVKSHETTATHPGRIIGTPAYMSPEQARGHATDQRTDIWSFGCVLYEMLTGRLPFEGETSTDTLARIIEREPDWKRLPDKTPESIRALLHCCLAKDTAQRLTSIAEAVAEIRHAIDARPAMSQKLKMIVRAVIIVALCVLVVRLIPVKNAQIAPERIRLAVLPFENLGSSEDEYFASGISSEVTARLTGIHGLAVIARQSTLKYKNRDKSIQQIASELGVDYILEGTIQREHRSDGTAQVRLIPQLVKVSDNSQIWAQTYDSNTTGIFQIQSDLSQQVAHALNITLLEPERQTLRSTPTENIEAYEYYLRGKMYEERGCWVEENARIAAQMCQKAVDLDPQFALAYAALSDAHIKLYWHRHDRSDSRLAMAKEAVDTALKLAPNLPEAHLVLGTYYYYGHLDYDRALEEYAIALRSRPNDALLYVHMGAVRRRQGKPELALAEFKKAEELNPRWSLPAFLLAETYALVRNYSEAEGYCDRAIAFSPDLGKYYGRKIQILLSRYGTTDKARRVVDQAMEVGAIKDDLFGFSAVLVAIFDLDCQRAQEILSTGSSQYFDMEQRSVPKVLLWAQISRLMGDQELEHKYYSSAKQMLEARILEHPEDPQLHSALGIALAGLGSKEAAIREGKTAIELLPTSKEAWSGLFMVENLARIYVMVGEYDMATEQVEYLLSIPGELSIPLLRLDPAWKPLHDHPSFKKLIESGK